MGCCASCDRADVLGVDTGYIAGAGPDVTASTRARAQMPATLFSDVVASDPNRPARMGKADYAPLHDFRERPTIVTATQLHDAIPAGGGVASLPGRFPAAGWDGEPGASSPVADRGGY